MDARGQVLQTLEVDDRIKLTEMVLSVETLGLNVGKEIDFEFVYIDGSVIKVAAVD